MPPALLMIGGWIVGGTLAALAIAVGLRLVDITNERTERRARLVKQ